MGVARLRAMWEPISPLLTIIANYLRDTNKHPQPITDPQAFNPYVGDEERKKKEDEKVIRVDFTEMRWILGG